MPYTENSTWKCCQWIAAKLAAARETASPLFCMPTSIAIAVVRVYSTWKILAARSPSIIPQKLWIATTPRTRTPQFKIFSALTATIPPMIITMATTEINGMTSETLSTCSPASVRRRIPRSTGIRITFTTDSTIAQKDTSTSTCQNVHKKWSHNRSSQSGNNCHSY